MDPQGDVREAASKPRSLHALASRDGEEGGWLFGLGFCSLLLSKDEPALQGVGFNLIRARVQGVGFEGVCRITASS